MKRIRIISAGLAAACLLGVSAAATEVDCDSVYCFTANQFATEETPLTGVCITALPNVNTGTVMLGSRVLRAGDILTAGQLEQLTFHPLRTEEDAQAVISYLPIYENRVEKTATMTISIRGKEDKAPVAKNLSLETYKNLPNDGTLKASDPEGEKLTYTVVRGPKRGSVEVNADGTFTYTPKKNKVGVDSFTYTAADPAGNVSETATVTIQILKPSDGRKYTDTLGLDSRFEAEWLRNTGLFVGEEVGGNACFYPDKTVTREEFLTMVVKLLEIPAGNTDAIALPANTPTWLKPYMVAAQRSGLMAGWQDVADLTQPITGAEAAVMLQNALDLTISADVVEQTAANDTDIPTWAYASLTVMAENGISLDANAPLTRDAAAKTLYQVSLIAPDAPGMRVIRMQK